MPSTRSVAGAALVVAVGGTVAAAAGVEQGLPAAVAVEQRPAAGGSGLSLYGLFVLLVVRVLALFGVSVELSAAGAPGGSWLSAVVAASRVAVPVLAAALVAGSVCWAAVRARRWRRSRRSAAEPGRDPAPGESSDAAQRPPANAVESNWAAAVPPEQAERATRTPGELAGERADDGAPEEAVTGLTRLFRAVRYGGRPATDERAQRAAEFARDLRDAEGDDDD